MKTQNISLIGDCQMKALSWYIQKLNHKFNVRYICLERWFKISYFIRDRFLGEITPTITNTDDGVRFLKASDHIICQHISEEKSEHYNYNKILQYSNKDKITLVNSMRYHPELPELLKGMIERSEMLNIDIPAHKLIEKFPNKIGPGKRQPGSRRGKVGPSSAAYHPNVFYFVELVREICIKNSWDYYSDELYNQLLKRGYPFGR